MGWLRHLFSQSGTRRVTIRNPLVIENPRAGFLNLLEQPANGIIEQDRATFGRVFELVRGNEREPPACDVLFLYCVLNPDGSVAGEPRALRELIDASGASIAIIASENSGDSYIAAGARGDHDPTNLVMTLERKGAAFGHFFDQLFQIMFANESMITAWVALAPQGPAEVEHGEAPETIFAAEISHIVFKRG